MWGPIALLIGEFILLKRFASSLRIRNYHWHISVPRILRVVRIRQSNSPFIAALISCILAGCGLVDKYEERMRFMNRSIDTSRNEMILLNIARARYHHPLSFMSITNVSGSQNASGSLGLPTITLGPGQTDAQKQFVFGNN